jgi:hypothetical protein
MLAVKNYKLLKTLNDEFVVQFKRFCTLPDDEWSENRSRTFRTPDISWTKWNQALEFKDHNEVLNIVEFSFFSRSFCFIYQFMSFEGHILYQTHELVVNKKNVSCREAIHFKELDMNLDERGLYYGRKWNRKKKIENIGNDYLAELARVIEVDESLHSTSIKDPPPGVD